MEIHPCVPDNWKQFDVEFKWKDAEYFIKYRKTGKYNVQLFEVDSEEWNKEKNSKKFFENELDYENQDVINNQIELKNKGNFIINVTF